MDLLQNISLVPVGTVIAAIGILGFVVFFNNSKSATNVAFLFFSLVAIFWNGLNYLAYQFESLTIVLWLLRFVLFFAVWYCFSLLHFFYVFPKEITVFSRSYKFVLLPMTAIGSLLTLTPWAIEKINQLPSDGSGAPDVLGPVMPVFGILVSVLITAGITLLVKKMLASRDTVRTQYRLILIGTIITFSCYIAFNFVLPVFFDTIIFIPLGAFFTFPFVAFTSYAVIKHKLMNVKVISSEILVFVLSVVSLLQVLLSTGLNAIIFRSMVFILVLVFGMLLIRSVVREVKQREQLQILDKQLEEANKQLKALDRARAEFISLVSHQMRTPPSTIKWYLASILEGDFGETSKDLHDALERLNITNNAQISLIEDLLNVSRIERGKMEFTYAETDIVKLTEISVQVLLPAAVTKNLKLIFKKPSVKIPLLTIDKEKVRQVINNLIDNAIKYTRSGSVTVEVKKTSGEVRVSVADTGKGIRPEEAGRIFDKFGRAKDSSNYAAGLGLGLFVAKVIMAQHHGKIWAESAGEGKGSKFSIALPIASIDQKSTTYDLVTQRG